MTRGGDETAEPLLEVFRLANHVDHHVAQTIEFILFNPARMLAAGEVRIAVVLAAEIVLQHIVGEAADQVAAVWPAEADGVVQGGFVGYAVVRESRWNIEDVARLQIFINDRWERIDVQQCRMRTELTHRQLVTHAPAAAAHALNNKDVILIDMRADTAAGDGEGDHQVVQAPVRQYAERAHQLGGRHMPVVYRLGQQGPTGFAQPVEMFKRTIAGLPFAVFQADQPAVDFRLHG